MDADQASSIVDLFEFLAPKWKDNQVQMQVVLAISIRWMETHSVLVAVYFGWVLSE